MKDDAIAQLSDQLMALTTRMQELERLASSSSPIISQYILGKPINFETIRCLIKGKGNNIL